MALPPDSSRPIQWGILGAGNIAATAGADIARSSDSEVVAVGARDRDRAARLATRLGARRAYGSYRDLVADADVDIVYIATTHAQHHEQALLALGAGKPILVEKAFTLNARQARDVVAAARKAGLFCMEAMWMRFNPLIRQAVDLARDGAIGDLISIHADLSALFPFDPRHRLYDLAAGGGALLDLGIYPTHLVWMFLGRPSRVQAIGALSPTGSDATSAQQWGYPGGQFAQLSCTTLGRSPMTALVQGTVGAITLDGRLHRPTQLTVHRGDQTEVIAGEPTGYELEVAEVERALRAGETESPVVPLQDTVEILEVIDQARAQIGVRYPADRE
jgi:predicted dehydrogenase